MFTNESVCRRIVEVTSKNNTSEILKRMVGLVEMNSHRETHAVVSDALFMIINSITILVTILRVDFKTTEDRLICEQTFMHELKAHSKGVNQDLSFISPYSYFHLCCQLSTSKSINNTVVLL